MFQENYFCRMVKTLDQLNIGAKTKIINVENSTISTKLAELGFIINQEVEVVFKAPFGDPIAIELNGSIISLRLDEASLIEVSMWLEVLFLVSLCYENRINRQPEYW